MHLLVSTPLHIFLVDPFSNDVRIIRAGDGYYYGITYYSGTLILTHTGGYLGYFGDDHSPKFSRGRYLIQPHQAEWLDGRILVANTGKNCISIFTKDGSFEKDVYLNDIYWDDKDKGRQGNHFNSIHKAGDYVFLVAHNYERFSEVWVLSWPNLEVVKTIVTQANWAHNLWSGELGMITCNSKYGSLQNILTGETVWEAGEDNVITRGLAVSDQYIFIGCSAHSTRRERYWRNGGIWVVERQSLRTVRKIVLPGSGDVHEIRLLDVLDECHSGEIIPLSAVDSIRKITPFVAWAYGLRKTYPVFRRDMFLFSHLVRGRQMIARWYKAWRYG